MTYPIGSISGFIRIAGAAQAQQDLNKVRAGMAGAGESASAAAGAITRTEGALAASGRAASSASSGAAKYRASQLSAVAATERYNAALADENASLARVASAEAAVIRANERLRATSPVAAIAPIGPTSETAASGMSRFGASMASAGKLAVGLGVTLGAFELVKKAIDITKQANEFQRAMVQVQTNADVTASEVTKASSALLSMAGPVAAAPAELAVAWYHAKSVGLDYAKSIETTKIATEGARVGNADLEETMNALTSTVASGIPGVQNMSSAMGQLIATVGAGDMKLSDLNEALGTGVLVRMKQYGLSLTDVGAALATFGDNNIRGADAATLLRMSVEAMAKQGAPGEKALAKIGIQANQLRDDLRTGGLNKALIDLNEHLKTAGVTGTRVGGFLIDAFTKKGGGGVSVLLGQLDRLESKFTVLRNSGSSFGDKWKATTQTASFAIASLGHQLEAAGIVLTAKLGPSIAAAATWLGTNLPQAISTLAAILGPTVKMIGGGLVAAWHGVAAVLGPVASALGTVGSVLAQHSGLISHVIAPVLAMWAAWKGYQIALVAARAIGMAVSNIGALAARGLLAVQGYGRGVQATLAGNATSSERAALIVAANSAKVAQAQAQEAAAVDRAAAMEAVANADKVSSSRASTDAQVANADRVAASALATARASQAAAAVTAASAEESAAAVVAAGEEAAIGWKAVLGPLALVAVGITALTSLFGGNGDAASAAAAEVDGYTSAIEQDTGAIGENTRAHAENALASKGAYQAGLQFGISQKTLTDAALGNKDAIAQVNAAIPKSLDLYSKRGAASLVVASALGTESDALRMAKTQVRDKAAADKASVGVGELSATAMDRAAAAASASAAAHAKLASETHLNVTASGDLAYTTDTVKNAADRATKALQAQTIASSALKTAQDLLNGVQQSAEQATDALSIGLDNLAHKQGLATDRNNKASTSLNQNTAVGATNRQMLLGLIQSAQTQAQVTADQTYKTKGYAAALVAGNSQLATNEQKIRAAASAAGFNKQQVDAMLTSLGKISHVHPQITINTNFRNVIADLGQIYDNIPKGTFHFNVEEDLTKHNAQYGPGKAAGGTITGGVPGRDSVPIMAMPGEEVIRTSQANKFRPLLKAINQGNVKAFAAGGTVASSSAAAPSAALSPISITIELDGEVIARRVVRPEIVGALDQFDRSLTYGRRS